MKKLILILLVLAVVSGGYLLLRNTPQSAVSNLATYSNPELGLEFDYETGVEGYTIEERTPSVQGDLVRTIIVYRTEDKNRIDAGGMPVGGEGPATISIMVVRNTAKLHALNWANANIQYSNINLKSTEPTETVVGGANAVRYTADGLYPSDNVVVPHGEYVYVLRGEYMDADSDLKRDFSPLVESLRFIPQPGQE